MTAMDSIFVVGSNHRTAPSKIREILHAPENALFELIPRFAQVSPCRELAVISTCNRFELIGVVPTHVELGELFFQWMKLRDIQADLDAGHLYKLRGRGALNHLYRVASSLDSLVIGETQITGQFKRSFEFARNLSTIGPLLERISQQALFCAKKVRTETPIGALNVSISQAAVQLIAQIFSDLASKDMSVVGAGYMGRLALEALSRSPYHSLTIANRNEDKARDLATKTDRSCQSRSLEDIRSLLAHSDVVICATSSQNYVIGVEDVKNASRIRRGKPMLLIDISLPRNIDPEIAQLDDVYLFDIDDLKQVTESNRLKREEAAHEAEQLIDLSLNQIQNWIEGRTKADELAQMKSYMFDTLKKEFFRSKASESFSAPQMQWLEEYFERVSNKMTGDFATGRTGLSLNPQRSKSKKKES